MPVVHDAGLSREPDVQGVVVRDGVRLAYAVTGTGATTVLLLPTWSILPSGMWRTQVATLARHHRVVTFDGRGSGLSGRPVGAGAYTDQEYAKDALAVLDATGTAQAVLVGLSCGASWAVHVAAEHPDRVLGVFALAPSCGFDPTRPHGAAPPWGERGEGREGWASYNRHVWLEGGYEDFLVFFFGQMFSESHSTKQVEDAVAWGREVSPATLVDTTAGRLGCDGAVCEPLEPLCRQVRCPVVVVHGTDDRVRRHWVAERLAELTGGSLVLVEGGGHGLHARDPVLVNRLLLEFVERLRPSVRRTTWTRAVRRPRKALMLCSPIGLGHARRDVAIAEQLQDLQPDLRIDWLTQEPVTRVLAERGAHLHPASASLLSEVAVFEAECGEHDLNAFQAVRRMDALLVHNFGVFAEVVKDGDYDLVIGDEAWDVDHFLHENPELKNFSFAWLTDFVGWLPMPEGGSREVALTADLNEQMLEQRARFRRVRDRSLFVGNPGDVVPADFGPGLPSIREWTADNYEFTGYVNGLAPVRGTALEQLRERSGVEAGEQLCLVTVGGSGVGSALLRAALAAVPLARRALPGLRFLFVTGPRIDPVSLSPVPGVQVLGYVPDLHHHLAACDVAVVQGGLTTCMELTALGKPFVYVPLQGHFEQSIHVRHRLDQYAAGRCTSYAEASDPEVLAAAIVQELSREVAYHPVETDGAMRAAKLLAELL